MFVYWNKAHNTFWSNEDGWVDIESATHFTREEINQFKHVPEGASPLELIKKFYEIIGTGASGGPITYRGHIYAVPGISCVYLALQKEFGDVAAWLADDDFHKDLRLLTGVAGSTGIDFTSDEIDYQIRIDDVSFDGRPRLYMLMVDHEILPKQIDTLSKLLSHLKAADAYEATVGAIRLLEAIQEQHHTSDGNKQN